MCPPAPPTLARAHALRGERTRQLDIAAQTTAVAAELRDTAEMCWPEGATEPGPPGFVEVPLDLRRVDAMAVSAGVSRFAVLLSVYAGTLAEVSGQHDFAVGVPVAQRDTGALENAVGCHITMLCLRLRGDVLDDGPEAIAAAGRLVARAMAAQDAQLDELFRTADPPGNGRPAIYQSLFALQDNPIPQLPLAGLRTTFLRQPYLALPLEFHAELWPDESGGARLMVGFQPDVVPATVAYEFAKRFAERTQTMQVGCWPSFSTPANGSSCGQIGACWLRR